MKLLFVQIGDMHIRDRELSRDQKIERLCEALRAVDAPDEVFLIVCGDLSSSGTNNEFKAVKQFIGSICSKLGSTFNKRIRVYVVPGNHDANLSGGKPKAQDVIPLLRDNRDTNYYVEVEKMKPFLTIREIARDSVFRNHRQ